LSSILKLNKTLFSLSIHIPASILGNFRILGQVSEKVSNIVA